MSKKKKAANLRQLKELMIIQTSMFYLTIFLEQAGVIKDNKMVEDVDEKFADITGAISLGKQLMFILSRVGMVKQTEALDKANIIMNETDNTTDFNYLVFVLILLMEYKENFQNKVYCLSISYDELNTLFDEYFSLGLKDRDQMDIIKDSSNVAEKYYEAITKFKEK